MSTYFNIPSTSILVGVGVGGALTRVRHHTCTMIHSYWYMHLRVMLDTHTHFCSHSLLLTLTFAHFNSRSILGDGCFCLNQQHGDNVHISSSKPVTKLAILTTFIHFCRLIIMHTLAKKKCCRSWDNAPRNY